MAALRPIAHVHEHLECRARVSQPDSLSWELPVIGALTEEMHPSSNMYYAMYNGGPAAYVGSYIVIAVGALCQTASFSELASIQPIAGAQYYWTYHFAPAGSRRFLAWIQGWVTWTGYVATFASSVNFGTAVLEGVLELNYPGYVVEGWRTTLISLATLAVITLVNLFAFRAVPWFDLFSGVLNILLFVAFMIIFLVMAPKNGGDIFRQTNVASGWENYYAASQIGSLSNVWLFIGKFVIPTTSCPCASPTSE